MIVSTYFNSPIGLIQVTGTEAGICGVQFIGKKEESSYSKTAATYLLDCVFQLEQYFLGKQKSFHSLRLSMHGTGFQQRVWDALLGVPFGETITYKELAKEVGKKNTARAVGNALNRNPLQIIVPCHRVISCSGDIGEYAAGRQRKKWLLKHEDIDI